MQSRLFKMYNRCSMKTEVKTILEAVRDGRMTVDDALLRLKTEPYADIGFAKVDLHRKIRQGQAEVIYGAGKTVEQIISIIRTMLDNGQSRILVTRVEPEAAEALAAAFPIRYHKQARAAVLGDDPAPDGIGQIVIATGGTSDIPVAEEAAITAAFFGNDVYRMYDVGVAGLHLSLIHI